MAIRFKPSASRHGISEARAKYVLEHHVWSFAAPRGVMVCIGPDRNAVDLEVGYVREGEDTVVIHAMKLRPAWRSQYRRHLS